MRVALFVFALLLPAVGLPLTPYPQSSPVQAPVTFHHVHLNSIDPARSVGFLTSTFDVTRKVTVAGFEGAQSENMFLLFNQVSTSPPTALASAIWHFGWGSTAMEADYARHTANGVPFQTPLTKLGSGLQFAYMKSPDGALVEINTSSTRAFIHVHLFSAAPLCAADWYVRNLGAVSRTREREGSCEVPFASPSEPLGVIRSPSATVRFGDVSLIIYPRQKPQALVSPRGRVVDHIGLKVGDLDATLIRLSQAGVKLLEKPSRFGKSDGRTAMIEGPDAIALELLELN